ncbi:hypothetical protein AB0I61_13300 [Polymorphospora rubra]|uniref:hypothetical protein n=1 Tax=Polymorphospora rubra TaxID=338584 RepID=UPI0033F5840C
MVGENAGPAGAAPGTATATAAAPDATAAPGWRRLRWPLLGLAVVLALLPATEPLRAAPVKGDTFIDAQTAGILDIEGGECFSDPGYLARAGEVVVLYRSCDDGAYNQSYAFLHASDGPWNRPALAAFAWAGCERDFQARWGSREASGLDFYPILPTEETWANGDRDVMCAVHNPQGALGGSKLPLAR